MSWNSRIAAGFGAAALCSALMAPAAAQDVLKIGASVSLSGPFAREGQLLRDGYDLWRDTVNAKGAVKAGEGT